MEFRRDKPKLSYKRRESTDLFNEEYPSTSQYSASTRPTSTPVRVNSRSEDEDSPYFPCSTQEMNEDVDVLWDWNSPQSKSNNTIKRKSRKRLNLQHSPKVPFRRHPSNNNEQIKQDFNKLREELRALKAEIAQPDHEESLVLSPREEEAFKIVETHTHIESLHEFDHVIEEHPQEIYEDDFQDPFDDDMDEKLIFFSQQVEKSICKPEGRLELQNLHGIGPKKIHDSSTFSNVQSTSKSSSINSVNLKSQQLSNKNQSHIHSLPKIPVNNCDNRTVTGKPEHLALKNEPNICQPVMLQKTDSKLPSQKFLSTVLKNEKVNNVQDSEVFDDSFDNVLSQMDDKDFDQLTQVVDIKKYKGGYIDCNADKKTKVFPRSLSDDLVVMETVQMTSGKVEWHRTQSFESYNAQLSREKLQEIERKRLEAKAKRDAKKKQEAVPTFNEISDSPIKCSPDEIEKKRLQALEKLEAKRLQDIIEKKKQEALKRREESRKKKAANVKSSLSTRL